MTTSTKDFEWALFELYDIYYYALYHVKATERDRAEGAWSCNKLV